MKIFRQLITVIISLSVSMQVNAQAPAAPRPEPVREITQIAGDIYRASLGNWHSLFLVTSEGIILADPLTVEFSNWLAEELDERFSVPVRYVIYSHSHWDHIEGGKVFEETATYVAHEGMLRNMDGRFPHMPGGFVDTNDNGQFERAEVRDRPSFPEYRGVCGSNFFDTHDLDGNDHVSPDEYFSDVRPPDIVYEERMKIVLGGKVVELIHPGKNHANDGTVLFFPAEKVAFSVDFPADALVSTSLRSLPSACGNFDGHPLSEWVKSYRSIEALNFDILVQGHGTVLFTKNDVSEAREYFEDLIAAVSTGIAEGLGLEEIKRTALLEKYKDWRFYDRLREDNIESAYFNLKLYQ